MIDRTLLTANDFIGVRAALVAELGNDAAAALVLTRIFYRADERWREAVEHDDSWWWRATVPTIAVETGLAETQVQRIVQKLAESGHIERVKHRITGTSDHTYSYRVICGIDPAISQDQEPSESRDLPTIKTIKTRDIPVSLDDFGKFYAIWPRKVGRPAAQRAFKAALKDGTPVALILAGAAAYRRWYEMTKHDIKFVPYPATWLNREGWNDQLVWPDATRPKPPAAEHRPRRLTAVEQNLADFERMHGTPPADAAAQQQRELKAIGYPGSLDATVGYPGEFDNDAVEPEPVAPWPHHARVDQRLPYPNAQHYQVYIRCPECESEWGWRDDKNGATADLTELATLHNSGARP